MNKQSFIANFFIVLISVIVTCTFSVFLLKIILSSNDLPIHMAVQENDLTEIKLQVKNGVDINALDSRGRSPLYLAALYGHFNVANYLLSNGADPNIGANWKDYSSPLHVAAAQGHVEIVVLLLVEGVNPNIQNKHGVTPLHEAARHRKPKVVEILLKNGVNVNAKDSNNKGVLHGYELSSEVNDDLIKTLELLIDAGADVNAATKTGETPLMNMVLIEATDAMKLLLSRGADAKLKNDNGVDALDIAESLSRSEAVEILKKEYIH